MNNINKMFKDWGNKKQILPSDNDAMKEKIFSKIPFNVERYHNEEKKKNMIPWTSFAFASIAVMLFVISPFISSHPTKPLYDMQSASLNLGKKIAKENTYSGDREMKAVDKTAPSFLDFSSAGLDEGMKDRSAVLNSATLDASLAYPNDDSFLVHKTDNREFLKIYYNAEIKARNVADMVSDVRVAVHSLGGRVDSSSSSTQTGYVSFSVPVSQFDAFRSQVKNLTHDFLFVENTTSDNLLPQKQAIEEDIKNTQENLSSLKSQKAEIVEDHEGMIAFFNMKLDGLNKEAGLLQMEWQTATSARKLEITARLAVIQGEKNSINTQIQTENQNYSNKISSINSKISGKQNSLNSSKKEDQNLIDTVSMVTGTISVTHVNLWQYADAFMPGPLLAWIFGLASVVLYARYRWMMRIA